MLGTFENYSSEPLLRKTTKTHGATGKWAFSTNLYDTAQTGPSIKGMRNSSH